MGNAEAMDAEGDLRTKSDYRVCPECQTGVMRFKRVAYFTWLDEELVTVPDFPARVCDVCGRREYDRQAILRLNTLLNPEAGRRRQNRRTATSKGDSARPQ